MQAQASKPKPLAASRQVPGDSKPITHDQRRVRVQELGTQMLHPAFSTKSRISRKDSKERNGKQPGTVDTNEKGFSQGGTLKKS